MSIIELTGRSRIVQFPVVAKRQAQGSIGDIPAIFEARDADLAQSLDLPVLWICSRVTS